MYERVLITHCVQADEDAGELACSAYGLTLAAENLSMGVKA